MAFHVFLDKQDGASGATTKLKGSQTAVSDTISNRLLVCFLARFVPIRLRRCNEGWRERCRSWAKHGASCRGVLCMSSTNKSGKRATKKKSRQCFCSLLALPLPHSGRDIERAEKSTGRLWEVPVCQEKSCCVHQRVKYKSNSLLKAQYAASVEMLWSQISHLVLV